MSQQPPEATSLWDQVDEFFAVAVDEEFDWDLVIGNPPDWYYPLVGRVAVATGGLERRFAETALHLLGWSPEQGGDLRYWLSSSARLRTLLGAAHGLRPDFDVLAKHLGAAWESRNKVVHVATGWHDWDEPGEPSGWHFEHPRTGQRVYLEDPQTKPALEKVEAAITDLDQQVWELYRSLQPETVPPP